MSASRGKAFWAGWVLTVLPVLLLLFSAVGKFMKPPPVVETFAHLGWPERMAFPLGVLELACVAVLLVPRMAVLGAILLTGYLGGAMATHVRLGEAWYIPAALGVAIWLGLWFREPRLRAVLPMRG